jgi:hypothetical protein
MLGGCVTFNATTLTWNNETVTTERKGDSCDCNTHHLSDFAIAKNVVPIESDDSEGKDNTKVGVVNFFVVLIFYVVIRILFCLFQRSYPKLEEDQTPDRF